jgi:phosphatidylinositol 4-kinase
MAAHSVVCYLLQIKDRYNDNLMYDNFGHILHIDFGFCFNITPGGMTFENAAFKLTTEMMELM